MESARVGKRGAIIVPARLRKRFGIEEGSMAVAEEKDDGILIRPAVLVPVGRYSPEREPEFLLSTAFLRRPHRHFHASALREVSGLVVTCIRMPDDPHARISSQHALDALGHRFAAIRNRHLAGVQRIANAYATAVVDRNPGSSCGCVQQSIEQGPIGHGVAAVFHAFGFAEWRGDRAAIEMIAANYDWGFDLALLHQVIHRQPELCALAVSEPADSCG